MRVPFLAKLSPVAADSPVSSLQIFSLLSALLSNPRSLDIHTPPLPFQSVTPTCAPLNPRHHQGVVGGHHLFDCYLPPTLVMPAFLRFKEEGDRAAVQFSCNLCDNCSSLMGKGEALSCRQHSHSWTDGAHVSI